MNTVMRNASGMQLLSAESKHTESMCISRSSRRNTGWSGYMKGTAEEDDKRSRTIQERCEVDPKMRREP